MPPRFECQDGGPTSGAVPRMWRINRRQFQSYMRAVFGAQRTENIPSYSAPLGFVDSAPRYSTNSRSYLMNDSELYDVVDASTAISNGLVEMLEREGEACLATEGQAECVQALLTNRARTLFRRSLADEEQNRLLNSYQSIRESVGHLEALSTVFTYLLSSPEFLFINLGPGWADNSEHYAEVVSLLVRERDATPGSYSALAEAPSSEIEAARRAYVRDRIGNPSENDKLIRFFEEYTQYRELLRVFKDQREDRWHNPRNLAGVFRDYLEDVVQRTASSGIYRELITGGRMSFDRHSRPYFGVDAGDGFLDFSAERRGFMTHPAFLVAKSHPSTTNAVARGKFIAETMFCQEIPPVPIEVEAMLPEVPGATMRELLSEHTDGTCAGCHQFLDDPGLALEVYDHLGRFRSTEHGKPILEAGVVNAGQSSPVSFGSAFELVDIIEANQAARECFVLHNFEYWLGRRAEQGDACTLTSMYEELFQNGNYIEMLVTLLTSDSFTQVQEAQ